MSRPSGGAAFGVVYLSYMLCASPCGVNTYNNSIHVHIVFRCFSLFSRAFFAYSCIEGPLEAAELTTESDIDVRGPFLRAGQASQIIGENVRDLVADGDVPAAFFRRTRGGHLRFAAADFLRWERDRRREGDGLAAEVARDVDPMADFRKGNAARRYARRAQMAAVANGASFHAATIQGETV